MSLIASNIALFAQVPSQPTKRGGDLSANAEVKKADDDSSETITLSPFVVTNSLDKGYFASNTLSGFGIDTKIQKTPQTLQIANQQLIQDLGLASGDLMGALEVASSSATRRSFNNGDDQFIWGFRLAQSIRDGVPTGASNPLGVLYDIDRVEVIKGPAAALFGQASAIGGVINYVPRKPTKKAKYRLGLTVGAYDHKTAQFNASGPITDKLRYRADLGWADSGAARQFGYNKDKFIGTGFEYDLNKYATISLDAGRAKADRASVWSILDTNNTNRIARVDPRLGDKLSVNSPYDDTKTTKDFVGAKFMFTSENQFSSLTSINYSNLDLGLYRTQAQSIDATRNFLTRVTLYPFKSQEHNIFFTQNFNQRFRTGWVKHSVGLALDTRFQYVETGTLKLYNYKNRLDLNNPVFEEKKITDAIDTNAVVNLTRVRNRVSGVGIYDLISFWNDRINAIYTFRYNNQFQVSGAPFQTYQTIPGITDTSPNASHIQTIASGGVNTKRYAITFEPIKDVVAYYNVGESFIFNGGVDYLGRALVPSIGQNKEFGVKASFLNGAVAFTAAHADITVDNVRIVFIQGPDDPRPGESAIKQGGTQTNKGVDFAINVNKDFATGSLSVIGTMYSGDLRDENKLKVQHVVNNTTSVFATYRITRGPLKGLRFGGGGNFMGERVGPNMPAQAVIPVMPTRIGSYWKYRALIGYSYKSYSLQLNVDNLANIKPIIGWENALWANTDPGRVWRISSSYSF